MKGEAELVNHAQGQVQRYLNLSSVVGKRSVCTPRRVVAGNRIPGAPRNAQFPIMAVTSAPHKDSMSSLRAFLWCPCGLKRHHQLERSALKTNLRETSLVYLCH